MCILPYELESLHTNVTKSHIYNYFNNLCLYFILINIIIILLLISGALELRFSIPVLVLWGLIVLVYLTQYFM